MTFLPGHRERWRADYNQMVALRRERQRTKHQAWKAKQAAYKLAWVPPTRIPHGTNPRRSVYLEPVGLVALMFCGRVIR